MGKTDKLSGFLSLMMVLSLVVIVYIGVQVGKDKQEQLDRSPLYESVIVSKDKHTESEVDMALFAATGAPIQREETTYFVIVDGQRVAINEMKWEKVKPGDKVTYKTYDNGVIGYLNLQEQ